jgi:hypothetical protein
MTTNELLVAFDVLQDSYGSDSFTQSEKLQFLNQAQLERLRRLIPDDQGGVNFELDQNTLFHVKPLIYDVSATMTSGGVVTFSTLTTTLRSASGDSTCNLHRIAKITWRASSVDYPVKFTKHNNWDSFKRNVFKSGSATAPRYKVDATNVTFDPINTSAALTVTAIKTPKIMEAGNSPDWDSTNLNLILNIALQLASTATRDHELLSTVQNSNIAK